MIEKYFFEGLLLIVGGIVGFIGAIGSKFLNEFFDNRARIAKHKLEIARHVQRIISQAVSDDFEAKPSNIEMINSTIFDLIAINKEMGVKLSNFINLWGDNARSTSGLEDLINAKNRKKLLSFKSDLLIWATNVRLGKKEATI